MIKQEIIFDDTRYYVTFGQEEVNCNSVYEFNSVVDILLTEKQKLLFIEDYRNRVFSVSEKRIILMKEFITSNKNPWRK